MRAIGIWAGVPVKRFFRDNYRLLGNIRDIQLMLAKIRNGEYIVPIAFTNWLESNLQHLKWLWQKKYNSEKINGQLKKLEKYFDDTPPDKKHSLKFEEDKNEKLNSFMYERPLSDEQIHDGRKTIKKIDFLNKWEKKNSGGLMKKLSDTTGRFMDRISEIRLLTKYIDEEQDHVKKNEALLILEKWKDSKEQMKNELFRYIDSLPNKAINQTNDDKLYPAIFG